MLSERTNAFIRKLKENRKLKDIPFIRAYSGRKGDYPVSDFLVTVSEGEETTSPFAGNFSGNDSYGERLNTNIILNVYCPCNSGGDGITSVINSIRESISSADTKNIVKSLKISEIRYSKEYEALYRSLCLGIDFVRKESFAYE